MRIASLQPSISLTLAHLNRIETLCAATKYCFEALPQLRDLPVTLLADSWSFHTTPTATQALLASRPDLVIASVPYQQASLTAILKTGLPLLALAPQTLEDIYNDIRLIGRQSESFPAAETLVHTMQSVLAHTTTRAAILPRKTVYCEEWGKPLIHSQRWVAELIHSANGDFLGTPGSHTTPEAIATLDPEVLLFAWCGAGDRVPLARIIQQRNWEGIRAVRNRQVFCIPDEYLNTPAFTLLEGLACITHALHPTHFPAHPRLIQLA